ncbi:hypothetical protein E1A91_A11G346200v1 [Gossypium mustelinum]|uniref:Uncharacterized protein n=1 Tax=Gossypium mustelinum TaxID=34275 RepID=A0A5D2XEH1_GOSMU|nr:hypothetical protein E1A91_A11G346200v1 [Gossypium mustelinum]
MGCSASRPNTNIITKPQNSSHSSTSLESMASSHSSPPPVSRALSLPTPVVHHPPLKKGDTHHLVSLTSTTYGSLSLFDVQKPVIDDTQSFSDEDSPVHGGQTESLSPDSVINTWELMDGLDDDDDVGHDFDLVRNDMTEVATASTEGVDWGMATPSTMGLEGQ